MILGCPSNSEHSVVLFCTSCAVSLGFSLNSSSWNPCLCQEKKTNMMQSALFAGLKFNFQGLLAILLSLTVCCVCSFEKQAVNTSLQTLILQCENWSFRFLIVTSLSFIEAQWLLKCFYKILWVSLEPGPWIFLPDLFVGCCLEHNISQGFFFFYSFCKGVLYPASFLFPFVSVYRKSIFIL